MEWKNVKQIILMYLLSSVVWMSSQQKELDYPCEEHTQYVFPLLVSINFPFITLIKTP